MLYDLNCTPLYAASFPTIGKQKTVKALFSKAAKKLFTNTKSDIHVHEYGYYDKLIVDCAYQKPLMNGIPDFIDGCIEFQPILTSNGLCHSFNGIQTEQTWYDSEITRAFESIFGKFVTKKKKFRGIGQSEGENRERLEINCVFMTVMT